MRAQSLIVTPKLIPDPISVSPSISHPTITSKLLSSPIPLETWMTLAWEASSEVVPSRRPRHRGHSLSSLLPRIVQRKERHVSAIPLLTSLRQFYPQLGIDLAARGHEVRKLFYAGFARGLVRDGYDPEDALQEVFKGLLTRNNGKCPFDARKSSFGHYVHIVTQCVLANYVRKERRKRSFESLETQLAGDDGRFSMLEMSDNKHGVKLEPGSLERLARDLSLGGSEDETYVLEQTLSMLAAGHSKRDVCEALGLDRKWLDKMLTQAREHLS